MLAEAVLSYVGVGVDPAEAQAVGDRRVDDRAPTAEEDVLLPRPTAQVPRSEEMVGEPEPGDAVGLEVEAGSQPFGELRVPQLRSRPDDLPECRVGIAVELGEPRSTGKDVGVTTFGDEESGVKERGAVAEEASRLFGRPQVPLGVHPAERRLGRCRLTGRA